MSAYTNLQPWSKRLGKLEKLGTKTHFAKLTHILLLEEAWGCCYKGLFRLSSSPHISVDCVELKLECITSTLHLCVCVCVWVGGGGGGGRGGKMPEFDELLR